MGKKNNKKSTKSPSPSSVVYTETVSGPEQAKLNQVLMLLDDGKPELALESMKPILSHWPGSLTAKAVNAICLQRTGKGEEALLEADFISQKQPSAAELIRFLEELYRRAPQGEDRLLSLFSGCVSRHKDSEFFHQKLFYCYARKGDWKSMQQVAGTLVSSFGSSFIRYGWWRVAALRAQCEVESETDPAGTKQKRALCAAMASRLPLGSVGEAELLCASLMEGERYDLVIKVLAEGQAVGKLLKDDVRRRALLAEAQEKSGNYTEALELYKTLLEDKAAGNNWRDYSGLVRCAVALEHKNNNDGKIESEVHKLFVAKVESKTDKRGGILAQMNLELSLRGPTDTLKSLLMNYITLFYAAPSCLGDVRPTLKAFMEKSPSGNTTSESISESVQNALGVKFNNKHYPEMGEVNVASLDLVKKMGFVLMIERVLGLHVDLTAAELCAVAKTFCCVHRRLCDLQQGTDDDLLLIAAAETLRDVYERSSDERVLLEAAALLESALEAEQNRPQVRLYLIDLYAVLGAANAAVKHFQDKNIDIKHVLLESCSHHILDLLLSVAGNAHEEGTNLLSRILAAESETVGSACSSIESAFKNGSFLFACDAATLRSRIERSSLRIYAFVERFLAQFASLGPQDLATGCSKLCDAYTVAPDTFTTRKLKCNADKKASVALDLFPITFEIQGKTHRDMEDPPFLNKYFLQLRYTASQVLRCLPAAACGKPHNLSAATDSFRQAIAEYFHPESATETEKTNVSINDLIGKVNSVVLRGALTKDTESLISELAYNVLLTAAEYALCYVPGAAHREDAPAKQEMVIRGVNALRDVLARSTEKTSENPVIVPATPFTSLARCVSHVVAVVCWISVISCNLTILAGPKGAWSSPETAEADFELAEKVLACTTGCAKSLQTSAIPLLAKQQADPEAFCVGFQNWLARGCGHTEGLSETALGTVASGVCEGREDALIAQIDSVASLAL